MSDWRYLAQDLLTGEWLHTDLPLIDPEIETELSGPGGISATISPEVAALRKSDGSLLLDEWSTAIYAEAGERIRGAGIVTYSAQQDDGQTWKLECPGFATYPHGLPFGDEFSSWSADPFDVVRAIWAHVQGQQNGDLGVAVSSGASGLTVGDRQPPSRPNTVRFALKAPTKGARPVRGSAEDEVDYLARVEAWEDDYSARRAVYLEAKSTKREKEDVVEAARREWDDQYGQDKPYELLWWEAPDCGREIDQLALEAGFDYAESHHWASAARDEVLHRIDLAAPMIGRRRTDLRFAVGENVSVIPDIERDGDNYANEILALGKGEGRGMLRQTVGQASNRLRRVSVLSKKGVGYQSRLRALADRERQARSVIESINNLVVLDHPNAPLGSFGVGDEILVQSPVGWMPTRMWCRIVSYRLRPSSEDTITMTVVPSGRIMA